MGDVVNTASKLKDIAPAGHIWVGRDTARATDADFTYVPAIRPEGTPAANAFELRSEREQIYRPRIGTGETIFAEHVGRDVELAALRAAVARLAAGTGGVAAVVGEPGLGKSRLLAELAASDEARRVRWAEGRSVPAGRTQRYHPFVDLVRSAARPRRRRDAGRLRAARRRERRRPRRRRRRHAAVSRQPPGHAPPRGARRAGRRGSGRRPRSPDVARRADAARRPRARASARAVLRGRALGGPLVDRAARPAAAARARPSDPVPVGVAAGLLRVVGTARRDRARVAATRAAPRGDAPSARTGGHAPPARHALPARRRCRAGCASGSRVPPAATRSTSRSCSARSSSRAPSR